MERLGILDWIGLAATLVVAVPIGVFGGLSLLGGDLLLGGFGVGVAVGLVALERVWTPGEVPVDFLQWVVGRLVRGERDD
ncbi:MAG: DUF7533 family protein [Halodesulfurarchaeum sp.]